MPDQVVDELKHEPRDGSFRGLVGRNLQESWEEQDGFCEYGCYWTCEHRSHGLSNTIHHWVPV